MSDHNLHVNARCTEKTMDRPLPDVTFCALMHEKVVATHVEGQ